MKLGSVNKIIIYGIVKQVDFDKDSTKIQVGVSESFIKRGNEMMHEELIDVVVHNNLFESGYASLLSQRVHIEGKICTIANYTVATGNTYYTYVLAGILRLMVSSISRPDSLKVVVSNYS